MCEMFKLKYGTEILPIRLEFSDRKTLGISVLPDCSIVATAPINAADDIIKQKLKAGARLRSKFNILINFYQRPQRVDT